MSLIDIIAIFLSLTAAFAYINHRFIGLPTTIGVMFISLLLSLLLIILHRFGITAPAQFEKTLLQHIDFTELLMDGMLSLLLFAGAMHVKLADLRDYKLWVGALAIIGTLVSAGIVAVLTYYLLPLLGLSLPFIWCLIFGALISPTDPIAVMGILKSAGAPKSVETIIAGESLFNDGIGVVVFTLLLGILSSHHVPNLHEAGELLLHEAGGGLLFGAVLGGIGYYLLKSIDSYQTEVLITLALVVGGYALASQWHLSGPLAMVIAGLLIGNHGREYAMSDITRRYVDLFWELIDEILNAVLFVLIGLEIMIIASNINVLFAAGLTIFIALFARWVVVGLTTASLHRDLRVPKTAWKIFTWGGLRGGISVALVLSLPSGEPRNILLTLTYAIVCFSILIQGLTIGKVVKHALPHATPSKPSH
ncbi:cation:proton antiporter [Suttonella ornithocola]|uniref:Potassium/proton antiporter n=1 Tax=Suttonella ornithocola TaxID=279832 RepID=A0A380ML44_9GAMM|nr:sodium:proton antiporter [Suttonella ornithocola]SUO93360.1 potassium/proton antiporter [Suttonella ornithocola]